MSLRVGNTVQEKTMSSAFDFSDPSVKRLYLGGYSGSVGFVDRSLQCKSCCQYVVYNLSIEQF